MSFFQYKKTKNPNPSPIKKMVFGFSCYEENVEPRDDVCVTKHGLKIPNHADHYEGFVARMKAYEQKFRKVIDNHLCAEEIS